MESLVSIATVLGGIAIVVQGIYWLVTRKTIFSWLSHGGLRKNRDTPTIVSLRLDPHGQLAIDARTLNSIVYDILHLRQKGSNWSLHFLRDDLTPLRCEYRRLSRNKRLGDAMRERRNVLYELVSKEESRLIDDAMALEGLLKFGWEFTTFDHERVKRIITGFLEYKKALRGKLSGTKLEIWKEKPYLIVARFWVDDQELSIILSSLDIQDRWLLTAGPGAFYAAGLPFETVDRKVFPAIATSLFEFSRAKGLPIQEMATEYNYMSWYLGLG